MREHPYHTEWKTINAKDQSRTDGKNPRTSRAWIDGRQLRSNNMRIWKWKLAATDVQTIEVPAGAKLLDVQAQGGLPNLWALCDENAPSTPRRIAIYGTGNPMPDEPGEYIATFQMHGGALVFHAFELRAA